MVGGLEAVADLVGNGMQSYAIVAFGSFLVSVVSDVGLW